jgi:hypothetical protein
MSDDEGSRPDGRGDQVSEARLDAVVPATPVAVLKRLEAGIPLLTERVARRVQAEVPSYAGPTDGRRRRLIGMAVAESSALFVRRLGGRRISTAGVDDLFRKMGYGEASESRTLASLEQALRIAGREAWQGLQDAVVASGLPASTLGLLGNELGDFLDHLGRQAAAGHAMAARVRERDATLNRHELVDALLDGTEPGDLATLADRAAWPLPAEAVVVACRAAVESGSADPDPLQGRALARAAGRDVVFVAAAADAAELITQLRDLGDVRLAQSWAVSIGDVCHAARWATRALDLVESGGIPVQSLIDCARYRTQLWLHAEPALRRQLAQDLLKPLFAETPNSREILSETLLVWLETRESAPAIAAILGVHPQTVRYRWRRINELFGDALRDPGFVMQLTMVLKASVPLWVAGDQSDFERYEESR